MAQTDALGTAMFTTTYKFSAKTDAAQTTLCNVRTLRPEDSGAARWLLHHGMLPGQEQLELAEALRIEQTHLQTGLGRGHFWAAAHGGTVIGTVAVIEESRDAAQLKWLRVTPPWQSTPEVTRELIRVAAGHAREMEFLKLTIHAPPAAQSMAVSYFHLLGFEFSRNRLIRGRNMLEFYLNLYIQPGKNDAGAR